VSGLLGPNPLLLFGGFLVVGTIEETFFDLADRAGTPRLQRRVFGILWMLVLLVGGPAWLVAAAGIGLF
jgi:hypothetical protein